MNLPAIILFLCSMVCKFLTKTAQGICHQRDEGGEEGDKEACETSREPDVALVFLGLTYK